MYYFNRSNVFLNSTFFGDQNIKCSLEDFDPAKILQPDNPVPPDPLNLLNLVSMHNNGRPCCC